MFLEEPSGRFTLLTFLLQRTSWKRLFLWPVWMLKRIRNNQTSYWILWKTIRNFQVFLSWRPKDSIFWELLKFQNVFLKTQVRCVFLKYECSVLWRILIFSEASSVWRKTFLKLNSLKVIFLYFVILPLFSIFVLTSFNSRGAAEVAPIFWLIFFLKQTIFIKKYKKQDLPTNVVRHGIKNRRSSSLQLIAKLMWWRQIVSELSYWVELPLH